jgi:MFS family permease
MSRRVPGALRRREFRLLFGAQVISMVGDRIVPVALAFAVLDLTGSVKDLGLVLAAQTLPLVGFLLIGGVFADRLPRRTVMVSADLVRFASQGLVAALLLSGHARLWHLIVLQAVHGTGTAFFNPAAVGLTPLTVPVEELQEANALRGIAMSAAQIAGPSLSGVLVTTAGSGWALAGDSGTFAASALLLGLLRLPPHERLAVQPFLHDLRDGWTEFTARTWIWVIVVGASGVNALIAPFFVLGPAIAKRSLGGAGHWAAIVAAMGVGSLLGGTAALRVRVGLPLFAGSLLLLLWAPPLLLLGLRVPTAAIAAAVLVAGLGNILFNALWETALQQHVPPAALSRVSAYDWFGSLAAQPLAFMAAGFVAGALGVNATLLAASGLLAATTLTMAAVPSVQKVRIVQKKQVDTF